MFAIRYASSHCCFSGLKLKKNPEISQKKNLKKEEKNSASSLAPFVRSPGAVSDPPTFCSHVLS